MNTYSQACPYASYEPYADEINQAIQRVLYSGRYLYGEQVEAFEAEFGEWMSTPHYDRHAAAVANGTQAIEIALRAAHIGKGHEVITTSLVPTPVVQAIVATGATPVLIDVNRDFSPRIDQIYDETRRHTRALIAVHLYGIPMQTMPHIQQAARDCALLLIEDCSQAHGAVVGNAIGSRKVGTYGLVATFSFYPTKNMAALGDAGALVTRAQWIISEAKALRNYGWVWKDKASHVHGLNSRMDEIQAAVLRIKLRYLDEETLQRRELAAVYRHQLSRMDFIHPPDYYGNVYHQFPVRVNPLLRNDFRSLMQLHPGIQTAIHYEVPVHKQAGYKDLCRVCRQGLSTTESLCESLVSLPMHRGLSTRDARYIANEANSLIVHAETIWKTGNARV